MANDYRFRPRILIDVSHIDMATNILGFNISMPIMIAPSAMQKMAHPEGPVKMFNYSFLLDFQRKILMEKLSGMQESLLRQEQQPLQEQ